VAFKSYSLTLTGAAQRLSSVLTDPTVGGKDDVSCRQIFLQGHHANTARIFVGDSDQVSGTVYGTYLPIPTGSPMPVVIGPFEAGPVKLSSIWVFGTLNEVLKISLVPF